MRHKKYAMFHAEIIRNGIPGLRERKSLRFLKISGPYELFKKMIFLIFSPQPRTVECSSGVA